MLWLCPCAVTPVENQGNPAGSGSYFLNSCLCFWISSLDEQHGHLSGSKSLEPPLKIKRKKWVKDSTSCIYSTSYMKQEFTQYSTFHFEQVSDLTSRMADQVAQCAPNDTMTLISVKSTQWPTSSLFNPGLWNSPHIPSSPPTKDDARASCSHFSFLHFQLLLNYQVGWIWVSWFLYG
jgi:hypothetical protein